MLTDFRNFTGTLNNYSPTIFIIRSSGSYDCVMWICRAL